MKTCHLICITLAIVLLGKNFAAADIDEHEGYVIGQCLERFGGPTLENAERLKRFKEWSITYEEIPCFTNCYLSKMFDFYNETNGFIEEKVIKKFGAPVYEVCKPKLNEGNNECEVAYNGFHCMVSLENDPFVVIDGMDNLNIDAKLAMKDCLHQFDRYDWQRFGEYPRFPVVEPIPCYTRCFVEKLKLFNHRLQKWNFSGLNTKLSIPLDNVNTEHCMALSKARNRNNCAWMYREFTCLVMATIPSGH
ncbi:odorant-binding protein 83cd [Haematobia irritans]|uniref:odorant-binding protein 83cd n=1 Tax=Haematobia irritans TaxID=7368 RepID=UPI003F501255